MPYKLSSAAVFLAFVLCLAGAGHAYTFGRAARGASQDFLNPYVDDDMMKSEELKDWSLANEDYAPINKRGGLLLPVVFFCKPKTAVCMNGGRGPSMKFHKQLQRPMCVCMCPSGYTAPQCGRKAANNV